LLDAKRRHHPGQPRLPRRQRHAKNAAKLAVIQPAIGGALGLGWVFSGGDGVDLGARAAMAGGFGENRLGKTMPIGKAAARGVIGAGEIIAPAFAPDAAQNGGNGIGQIGRSGGAAPPPRPIWPMPLPPF